MKRLIIKLASFFSLPTEMEVTWKREINVAMLSSLCHSVYTQRIDLSVHVVPKPFQCLHNFCKGCMNVCVCMSN